MSHLNLSKRQDAEGRSFWAANIQRMLPKIFMIGLVVLLAAIQYAHAATSP
jgi:uncharacterized membrane protein